MDLKINRKWIKFIERRRKFRKNRKIRLNWKEWWNDRKIKW
jgi:hypothetical protein